MAVPGSGQLSQLAMAQEALYGTYGSGSVTGPISLYDMTNGGNTNGSGNSYPIVNTGCLPNPASRSSTALPSLTYGMGGATITLYYNSTIGTAPNLVVGDYLYTNSNLTTPASTDYYTQPYNTSNSYCTTSGTYMSVTVGSGGVIFAISCVGP